MADTQKPASAQVTASDVEQAVRLARAALGATGERAWSTPAGSLEWDCWETVEHLADCLVYYALQLGPQQPSVTGPLPLAWQERRGGGPVNLVFVDREGGRDGLLQSIEACGALLAAMVRTTPPDKRAYHSYGRSDAEGFAAMGVVETLVHTHDIAEGLGLSWTPPGDLCARVLTRLFPHVPAGIAEPWPTLLWATGRIALEGRPRLGEWRWKGVPHGDREAADDQE